MSVIRKDFL